VGFLDVCCEMYQICNFCVANVSLKQQIEIKTKLTVSNLSYIHNAFVSVHSDCSVSLTTQN
jgi:hypothetical protein